MDEHDHGEAQLSNSIGPLAELFDMACKARCTGILSPPLIQFCKDFVPPRTYCTSPLAPSAEYLDRYTLWLICVGISHSRTICNSQDQPVTFSGACSDHQRLSREFFINPETELMASLEQLERFYALMLRYPVLPEDAFDTKECPECIYEAEVTRDNWEETRRGISCHHLTLRHELFGPQQSGANAKDSCYTMRGNICGVTRASTSSTMFDTDVDISEQEPNQPLMFMEQLEYMKRRDEIAKQNTLAKQLRHDLEHLRHLLEEQSSPRYLSEWPLALLCQMYGSLSASRTRLEVLGSEYEGKDHDRSRAMSNIMSLQQMLKTVASTGTNNELLSMVARNTVDPSRRYMERYNVVAQRIGMYKHLLAAGFPVETANDLVASTGAVNRYSLIGLTLEEGVRLQLVKTVNPTSFNKRLATLIWVFAHLTAYCTLRNVSYDHVRPGDSPGEAFADGIYVFDNFGVGFSLTRNGRVGHEQLGDSRLLELLAMRDNLQERLC